MPKLIIDAGGRISMIYRDDLRSLLEEGRAEIRRASHVEPTAANEWAADMAPSGGPVLGPFVSRADALEQECRWIEREVLR